jgi:hypothetical protein
VRLERVAEGQPAVNVPVKLTVPAANPRALLLEPAVPLSVGQYQVVLSDASGAGVTALNGDTLVSPLADSNGDRLVTRFTVTHTDTQ